MPAARPGQWQSARVHVCARALLLDNLEEPPDRCRRAGSGSILSGGCSRRKPGRNARKNRSSAQSACGCCDERRSKLAAEAPAFCLRAIFRDPPTGVRQGLLCEHPPLKLTHDRRATRMDFTEWMI
jgi:hypothetical protein